MSVDSVSSIAADVANAVESVSKLDVADTNAYEALVQSLESLNARMTESGEAVENLALGDMDNLHQVIMTMERSRLSFELMMSMRNRALEAYQEIMRMQL